MLDLNTSNLVINGPKVIDQFFHLYEAIDDSSPNPGEHIYSCVVLCRKDWERCEWPALGGTRWYQTSSAAEDGRQAARTEARELAMSMYVKNKILRQSERQKAQKKQTQPSEQTETSTGASLFGWQGGKGVIWTPFQEQPELSPKRLLCHGRLIESLKGEYFGSKDVGIGTGQLKWIGCATRYIIGLGCKEDTGIATAEGVYAGMKQAVCELENGGVSKEGCLKGKKIMVFGVGKVGLPLICRLHKEAAEVFIYDPKLQPTRASINDKIAKNRRLGSKIPDDRQVLEDLLSNERIFSSELEALKYGHFDIVSPNGGETEWLSAPKAEYGGRTRADMLANHHGQTRKLLIIGAGNDQIATTEAGKDQRNQALRTLDEKNILFFPDAIISPGGVIAVSHELAEDWESEKINRQTRGIVANNVTQIFQKAAGTSDSNGFFRAFENMIGHEWN